MSNPQQPEVGRSRKTPAQDPDAIAGTVGSERPGAKDDDALGPVPAENQPGHHPEKEQDKPDLDAFAARLGTGPGAASGSTADPATPVKRVLPRLKERSRRGGLVPALGVVSVFLSLAGLLTLTRRRRRRR